MSKQKDDKACSKLVQILTALDIQSTLNEKYAEEILHKEGNINFPISAKTVLGSTEPELLGSTALHVAYKKRKLKLFNLLLSHDADFTIKNERGSTVLHEIVEDTYEKADKSSVLEAASDNPFITAVLDAHVKSEESFDPRNTKGLTHFHIACMANHKAAVKIFLKKKMPINWFVSKDSSIFPGYTALHFAAMFSSLDTVKILLENGAVSNFKAAKVVTPLHVSIQQNIGIADLLNKNKVENAEHLIARRQANEDIIRLLLRKSPGKKDPIDDTNLSRLHVACVMESSTITEDLLGNVDYINQAVDCNSSFFSGNTALHFAALCNVEKVKLLLQNKANIHLPNAKKQTVLDLCLERYDVKDIRDIISTQPNWSKIELYRSGKTLLDLLSCMQSLDFSVFQTAKGFINACVDKKSPLWPTYRLLHLAVIFSERNRKSDDMLIERVMREETPLGSFAVHNTSPLHLAFRLKKAKVVDFLLRACQSAANFIDNDNLSHLHIACAAGLTDVVEDFLLGGAAVNAPVMASYGWYRHPVTNDSNASPEVFIPRGSSPLHIAVIVGHCEVIELLVNHGADIYAKDEYGMTPIHWLIVSDNPISPAADILLSTSKPVSSPSSPNKRFAKTLTLKESVTISGLSHLHVACFANNTVAIEQLLRGGSKVNAVSFRAAYDDAKRFPGRIRYAGYTPLHFALEGRCEKTIDLLIRHGAEVLAKNPVKNWIPLYEALTRENFPGAGVFRSFFKSNKALQKQLQENVGLTRLHFCCFALDDKAVEESLNDEAADVNKPIPSNSPLWPGFTPMHVLMKFYEASQQNSDDALKVLLSSGADVTLANAEKSTPLHLAYELDAPASLKSLLLKLLLTRQKNFNVNPQNRGGLSHFHIACAVCDIDTIENFLEHEIDVNQPIDYFYGNCNDSNASAGCSPLHLVLFSPLNQDVEVAIKLKAARMLIRRGADLRAENAFGNTLLHHTAKMKCDSQCIDLFKKIINAGVDVNAKNILSQTPFEMMLYSKDATIAGIQFFLDRGCCANAFNPISQKGFIAMTFSANSCDIFQQQIRPVFEAMMKACGNALDETGRTVIHNIVSTSTPVVSEEFYIQILESLVKTVDIDHRDNLGRTALHIASQFKNYRAISALLQTGADINIVDENKRTAFVYAFETSPFFDGPQDYTETVVKIFSAYVQKLNVCILDVHEVNHGALIDAIKSYSVDPNVTQRFYKELEDMKNVKLRSSKVTLLNFVSGTNTQSVSAGIVRLESNVIDNLFKSIDKERFCESLGIIRLQCRKISKKKKKKPLITETVKTCVL